MKYYIKKKYPKNELLQSAIWVVFNILASITPFHSPGGAKPQYLNHWLNLIFAFTTFKNSMSALHWDTRLGMRWPVYLLTPFQLQACLKGVKRYTPFQLQACFFVLWTCALLPALCRFSDWIQIDEIGF